MSEGKATPPDWVFESASPEATQSLGRALAGRLRGGEVILLRGPLGAGKTLFTATLAAGLDVREPVVSPTFVLLRSYTGVGGLTLNHLDFYRLEGAADLETLGVEELTAADSITVVEWPERGQGALGPFTLDITFVVTGDSTRRIEGRLGALPFDGADWPPPPL